MELEINNPMIWRIKGETSIKLTKSDYEQIGVQLIKYFKKYGLDCNKNVGGERILQLFVDKFIYPETERKLKYFVKTIIRDKIDSEILKYVRLLDERVKIVESKLK